MEKKNSLLLSVIAVATLLVAVVGATFAYFTVTGSATTSTTAINTTTESVGSVLLTGGSTAMHITTTAGDFAETAATKTMWATATAGTNYKDAEELGTAYTVSASGGSNTAIYRCTFGVTVSTTGIPQGATPRTNTIDTGEYVVYLKVGAVTAQVDVGSIASAATRSVDKTVTVYLTGNTSKTLQVSAKLVNQNYAQDYLKSKTINTTFGLKNGTWSCDTVASTNADTIA